MTQNQDSSGGNTGSQPSAGDGTHGQPEGYPAYAPGYPPAPGYVPPAGYPAPPVAGYGYPPAQPPGYQQPYQQAPGYPPAPGYPGYGYPVVPGPPAVPGNVRAAAVLAFVQGGLLILAGLITISFADNGSDNDFGLRSIQLGSEDSLLIMGVLTLIAGGLLIAGGVQLPRKKSVLLLVGSGISLVMSVWWLITTDFDESVLIWALLLAAMPIISASLAAGQTARQWMAKTN